MMPLWGLVTNVPSQRVAIVALAKDQLARDGKGLKSHINGKRSKGRPKYEPTAAEKKAAYQIWHNQIDYPEWPDADAALRREVNPKFTAYRAYDLWRGRKLKKR